MPTVAGRARSSKAPTRHPAATRPRGHEASFPHRNLPAAATTGRRLHPLRTVAPNAIVRQRPDANAGLTSRPRQRRRQPLAHVADESDHAGQHASSALPTCCSDERIHAKGITGLAMAGAMPMATKCGCDSLSAGRRRALAFAGSTAFSARSHSTGSTRPDSVRSRLLRRQGVPPSGLQVAETGAQCRGCRIQAMPGRCYCTARSTVSRDFGQALDRDRLRPALPSCVERSSTVPAAAGCC